MTERQLWFWINNIEGIGNAKIRHLLEQFKTPLEIYNADRKSLDIIPSLCEKDINNILNKEIRKINVEKYEKHIEKGIKMVFPFEKEYPKKLKELYDKPFILYYKGELPKEDRLSVSIIGSRKCTEYGRYNARELGRLLSLANVNVISGLAYGIDSEAHRGAVMAGQNTYAILAGDVNKCYPYSNYNLYMDIVRSGGIISEFGLNTPTVPGLFPLRNRIVSGLSDAVIMVEAGNKSGSLITVSHALNQNRLVYAVPGRINDPQSEGCNRLISEGAGVIVSYDTLLKELGLKTDKNKVFEKNIITLASEEKMLYSLLLDFVPKSLDTLIGLTDMSSKTVLTALLGLELKGYIKEISKNFYVRIE